MTAPKKSPPAKPVKANSREVFWRLESYQGDKLMRTDDFMSKRTAELYGLGLSMHVGFFSKQIIKPLPLPSDIIPRKP